MGLHDPSGHGPPKGGGQEDRRGMNPGETLGPKSAPIRQNRTVGAPSRLTDEIREQLEDDLAHGASQAAAAQRVGIGRRTLQRWLADGRVIRREAEPLAELSVELPLYGRLATAEAGLVASIIQAAQLGSWQAAAWMLERAFPERWSRGSG